MGGQTSSGRADVVNGQNTVTLPIAGSAAFYRLAQ